MIGAVWGLAVVGRTNAKGMPKLADAALLAETSATRSSSSGRRAPFSGRSPPPSRRSHAGAAGR